MKIKPIAAALVALGTLSTASLSMAGETEDRIAELERQLAELKSLVTANSQAASVAQEATVVNAADIEEARPSKKGTKFQYGGFIQLDMAATNYSEGKPGNDLIEDFLVPSLIPVSDGSGSSYSTTNMHAKTSRFFFTTATDTDAGKISTRVELDFLLGASGDERISNSWNPRLRHAFVKWDYDEGKSLLAGQSWSTFFNVGALPNQIDFVGPVGTLFDRQPQIRWTMGGLQLAAENPATRLNVDDNGSLSTSFDDFHEGIPDLVARYNGNMGEFELVRSWHPARAELRRWYRRRLTRWATASALPASGCLARTTCASCSTTVMHWGATWVSTPSTMATLTPVAIFRLLMSGVALSPISITGATTGAALSRCPCLLLIIPATTTLAWLDPWPRNTSLRMPASGIHLLPNTQWAANTFSLPRSWKTVVTVI